MKEKTTTSVYFWFNKQPKDFVVALIAIVFVLVTMFGASTPAGAAVDQTINYQAKITDGNGTAITDGDYAASFRICDDAVCTTTLWSENWDTASGGAKISVKNGLFSVRLGTYTSFGLDFNNNTYYLGVNFNNDGWMTPQKRLSATPFSLNSDRLGGLHAAAAGGQDAHILATTTTGNILITGTATDDYANAPLTVNPTIAGDNDALFTVFEGSNPYFGIFGNGTTLVNGDLALGTGNINGWGNNVDMTITPDTGYDLSVALNSGGKFVVNSSEDASFFTMNDTTNAASLDFITGVKLTPEGFVSANVGSLYIDSSGGSIFFKETGTGTTGWIDLAATGTGGGSGSVGTFDDVYEQSLASNDLTMFIDSVGNPLIFNAVNDDFDITYGSAGALANFTSDGHVQLGGVAGSAFGAAVRVLPDVISSGNDIVFSVLSSEAPDYSGIDFLVSASGDAFVQRNLLLLNGGITTHPSFPNGISITPTDGYDVTIDMSGNGYFAVQATADSSFLRFNELANSASFDFMAGTQTTPEGSVAANVGSLYIDHLGGSIFFKETGTSNTGWVDLAASGSGGGGGADSIDDVYNNSVASSELTMFIDGDPLVFDTLSEGKLIIDGTGHASGDVSEIEGLLEIDLTSQGNGPLQMVSGIDIDVNSGGLAGYNGLSGTTTKLRPNASDSGAILIGNMVMIPDDFATTDFGGGKIMGASFFAQNSLTGTTFGDIYGSYDTSSVLTAVNYWGSGDLVGEDTSLHALGSGSAYGDSIRLTGGCFDGDLGGGDTPPCNGLGDVAFTGSELAGAKYDLGFEVGDQGGVMPNYAGVKIDMKNYATGAANTMSALDISFDNSGYVASNDANIFNIFAAGTVKSIMKVSNGGNVVTTGIDFSDATFSSADFIMSNGLVLDNQTEQQLSLHAAYSYGTDFIIDLSGSELDGPVLSSATDDYISINDGLIVTGQSVFGDDTSSLYDDTTYAQLSVTGTATYDNVVRAEYLSGIYAAPRMTVATGATAGTIASMYLQSPAITDVDGGSVTNAATLFVGGAPTEGINNYGIYSTGPIESGSTINAGLLTQGGVAVCLADGTNCPSGSSVESYWTRTTGIVNLLEATNDVTIGASGSYGKLGVLGDTVGDTSLFVRGANTTEITDKVLNVQSYFGGATTDNFYVDGVGRLTYNGTSLDNVVSAADLEGIGEAIYFNVNPGYINLAGSDNASALYYTRFGTAEMQSVLALVTVDDIANVYIDGAPYENDTSLSFTRAWALWAASGDARFDEDVVVGVGPSFTTESISNSGFSLDGNDLYVADSIGASGDVYTNANVYAAGSFVAGSATTYTDGAITTTTGQPLSIGVGGTAGLSAPLTLQTGYGSIQLAAHGAGKDISLTASDDIYISASDGAGAVYVNDTGLIINDATNKVGINVATAASIDTALHVVGSNGTYSSVLTLQYQDYATHFLVESGVSAYGSTGDVLIDPVAGRMYINRGGWVDLSDSNPATTLTFNDIYGNSVGVNSVMEIDTHDLTFQTLNNQAFAIDVDTGNFNVDLTSGDFKINTNGGVQNFVTFDDAGYVGIGTTPSSSYKMYLKGDASTQTALRIDQAATDRSALQIQASTLSGSVMAINGPFSTQTNDLTGSSLNLASVIQDGTHDLVGQVIHMPLATSDSNAIGLHVTGNPDYSIYAESGIAYINDGLHIAGGHATFDYGITMGNDTSDWVTFNGYVNSSILPASDDVYALGSSSSRWSDLYVGPASLHVGEDGNEAVLSYNTNNSELSLSSDLAVEGALSVSSDLAAEGDLSVLGGGSFGDATTDWVTFNGYVNSSIIPASDDVYALGSSLYRWSDLYVGPASLHVGEDGNEAVLSYNTSNSELSLSTDLAIEGALSVADSIGASGDVYTNGSFIAGSSTQYGNGTISQGSGEILGITTDSAALTLNAVNSSLYLMATNDVVVDASKLNVVDGSNARLSLSNITAVGAIDTGHSLGRLQFNGGTNSEYVGAYITAISDGLWDSSGGSLDAPTNLKFYTQTNDGVNGFVLPRMIIDSNGSIGMGTNDASLNTRLDVYNTDTTTLANDVYGQKITVVDTGITTSGVDTTSGLDILATNIGGAGSSVFVYGLQASAEGDSGGASYAFGGSFTASNADTVLGLQSIIPPGATGSGDSYGLRSLNQGAYTNNYGIYSVVSGGDFNYAGYFSATGGSSADIGLMVANGDVIFNDNTDVNANLQINLPNAATTNGLCHSGPDVDGAGGANRDIVACSNTPSDLAEWYDTSGVSTGDIVVATGITTSYTSENYNAWSGEGTGVDEIRDISVLAPTSQPYQDGVIGVVSTSPWKTMGAAMKTQAPNAQPIAVVGRVPVKVSTENGAIHAGDPITTSSIAGAGMKATKPGWIIGYALDSWSGAGQGEILLFVDPGWNGGSVITTNGTETFFNDNQILTALDTADSTSTGQASYGLYLRGSGWDGVAAQDIDFSMQNVVTDESTYKLSILNNTGVEIAALTQDGDMTLTGGLNVTGTSFFAGNIGIGRVNSGGNAVEIEGALCVDDADPTCSVAGNPGWIYAEMTNVSQIDLAENYPSTQMLEPGELVVVDAAINENVVRSSEAYQMNLLGIVSTSPGLLLGSGLENAYPIAMAGRIPVKVSAENGTIARGDYLTSSSVPGVAMKATDPGVVVGIALEPFDGSGEGMVVTFVNLGWFDGVQVAAFDPAPTALTADTMNMMGDLYMNSNRIIGVSEILGDSQKWAIDANGVVQYEVAMDDSGNRKQVYGLSSTNVEVTISGSSQLVDGHKMINFADVDPDFARAVSVDVPLKIIVTATGATSGIYVSDKIQDYVADEWSHAGFTVQENAGGSGTVTFDWIAIGRRVGYEDTGVDGTPVDTASADATPVTDPVSVDIASADATPVTDSVPIDAASADAVPVVDPVPIDTASADAAPVVDPIITDPVIDPPASGDATL